MVNKNTTPEPSLDAKIARALGLPSVSPSVPLLALIVETTSAIEAMDEAGRVAH